LDNLATWGLSPALLWAPDGRDEYLAAPAAARLETLLRALSADSFRAVWAARGGYGTGRIAGRIRWSGSEGRPPPRFPTDHLPGPEDSGHAPLLVGFSDFSLLFGLPVQGKVRGLHAPNVTTLSVVDPRSLDALAGILLESRLPDYGPLSTVCGGTGEGPLLPMNLSLLASSMGTPLEPDVAGRILVIEEVHEAPYRVDRLLQQVASARWFKRLAGLVVGDLDGALDSPLLRRTLTSIARDAGIPCATGFPVGHGACNLPVPVGLPARLEADSGRLLLLPP